jgi:hypothetical protein
MTAGAVDCNYTRLQPSHMDGGDSWHSSLARYVMSIEVTVWPPTSLGQLFVNGASRHDVVIFHYLAGLMAGEASI